ncbi:hypothetical protein ABRY74_12275 [Pseudomonas guariconensis]|uniref:hypothetical protein n=1 Tax=Pseudomonas guariconensis TaxID=1288410 RepID=UPI003EE11886
MFYLVIVLVATQALTLGAIIYLLLTRKKPKIKEIKPYSQFAVGGAAFSFALAVIFLFFIFVADDFSITGNMGQVGDFIGGLTNPILSFVALIVLLRTTLIQTAEARKTAEILLEQQKLLEEERFETGYYALHDRLENFADKHLRLANEDGLTELKMLRVELIRKQAELNALDVKVKLESAKKFFLENTSSDKYKRFAIAARRLFNYIDESKLSFQKKKYYVGHFLSSLEPAEQILFLEIAFFNWPKMRKRLRKYRPAYMIRSERFVIDALYPYYCKQLVLVNKSLELNGDHVKM